MKIVFVCYHERRRLMETDERNNLDVRCNYEFLFSDDWTKMSRRMLSSLLCVRQYCRGLCNNVCFCPSW